MSNTGENIFTVVAGTLLIALVVSWCHRGSKIDGLEERVKELNDVVAIKSEELKIANDMKEYYDSLLTDEIEKRPTDTIRIHHYTYQEAYDAGYADGQDEYDAWEERKEGYDEGFADGYSKAEDIYTN